MSLANSNKVEKLFNSNFLILSTASFLMFVSFYLLMPIIAMYTIDEFGASPTTAGYVVSSYIITALLMRPFSGYLVDKYNHRKFYIFTMAMFSLFMGGYIISNSIGTLILTRVLLGTCFAIATTAGSTLIIDVLPSHRRSEGIGYYGAFVVLSMAVGPMLGLYLLDIFHYKGLFIMAMLSSAIGFLLTLLVKTDNRKHNPGAQSDVKLLSFDRFFLKEATPIGIVMALIYFLNGAFMVYVSIYIKNSGLDISSGNFFLLFAIGVIASRTLTGKALNQGKNFAVLVAGLWMIIIGTTVFIYFLNEWTFMIVSVVLGAGFGGSGPAVQTMMIDLVAHNRRGTANSTYFIALDSGSGMGMLLGGLIASHFSYQTVYLTGLGLVVIAYIFLKAYAQKDYIRKKKAFEASQIAGSTESLT